LLKSISAILLAVVVAGPSIAARADAIDEIVASEMQRQRSPSVAVSVVKDGRMLKVRGYGVANLEHKSPATASTFFQTASIGKQFTAALVMLLVRDGKLQLDEVISTYLPDAPPTWNGITVRHLLNHTSGLDRIDPAIDLRKDYTEAELLKSAYKVPLIGRPGEQHEYSNLGYQVLGFLSSRAAGKFYGDQLRERVFGPLGMAARVINEQEILPGRAAGYERFEGRFGNQLWVAPSQNTTADGSLYVSAIDMARWSVALQGQQILTKAEKEAMWRPTRLTSGQMEDYGFGWRLFNESGHRLVRHRGDWQGFTTHILHMPEDRLTIVVLMNRAHAQPHVIADRLAGHYVPTLRKPQDAPPTAGALLQQPVYLRGSMNEWKPTVPFVQVEADMLQARATLAGGIQQFKIGDADWKVVDLGVRYDEASTKVVKTQYLEFKGENIFMDVGQPGEYTFQLRLRAKGMPTLTVLPPPSTQK
jgi:CubicO group peptidase (beta-lactamase class C family)